MKKPVWIVGMGIDRTPMLSPQAQDVIQRAQILIGGERLLAQYAHHPGEKLAINRNLEAVLARIAQRRDEEIVLLASGDPGFHSIAGTLIRELPDEEINILPNVNALQAAFARIGVPWNDAIFTSAHGHPLAQIIAWTKRFPKVGILTDQCNTPRVIAEMMLNSGLGDCRVVIAENLGGTDESIIDTNLSVVADQVFAPLNVMLVLQDKDWRPEPVFQNRNEDSYEHRRGLITKRDLRALSIARMRIRPTDVIWDIGAGSGAVSIEIAEMAWQGRVFAIEKDPQNIGFINRNRKNFGAFNLEIVSGEAPEALGELPIPQAVFIGGSGGKLPGILRFIEGASGNGCRVVCNLTTFENLNTGLAEMNTLGWKPTFSQVNISHSKTIASFTRLEPLNPIFILTGDTP
jgi:precorrin-6B C5,15-methyltransferase / cobalt-precorrin-6B C5,C15-methyltransferase